MKRLITLVSLVFALTVSIKAQESMTLTSLAANTSSNVLAFAAIIDNLTIINATTNMATVKFFDSGTVDTNYIQAAYTSYASYATNFNVVFTNQNNVLVTNTFVGLYTAPTVVAIATNTRTAIMTLVMPASAVLNKDVKLQVLKGLTAVPDQTVTLTTTYRRP
jgi:hypothetical protein